MSVYVSDETAVTTSSLISRAKLIAGSDPEMPDLSRAPPGSIARIFLQ
jgi:hypothetical protein